MVGVRDIYIYLYNEDKNLVVPKVFTLYTQREETSETKEDDYSTYVPVESELKPLDNRKEVHYEGVIPKNTSVELGTCYLLSNNFEYGSTGDAFNPIKGEWSNGTPSDGHPKLKVAIKAILYDAERPDNQNAWVTETWEDIPVETWTDVKTGDKLLPGYEYKVTLVFNRASVALRAEAVPWEDEELHEYPVHPMSTTPTPGN